MRLYDGKKLVEIKMSSWTGNGYTPDWSHDFFEAGGLVYDRDIEASIVEDVDYCIDQAMDWKNAEGDFYEPDADPEEVENRSVDIEEFDSLEIEGDFFEDHGTINIVRCDDMFVVYTGQGHDISGRWYGWSQIKVGDKLPTGGTFTTDMLNEAREKATGVKKFELRF